MRHKEETDEQSWWNSRMDYCFADCDYLDSNFQRADSRVFCNVTEIKRTERKGNQEDRNHETKYNTDRKTYKRRMVAT